MAGLECEIATFEAHRAALVSTALGRYALVYGDEVVDVYDNEREAIVDGRGRFGYVPILVERITAEGEVNPITNTVAWTQSDKGVIEPITRNQPGGALHHFGPVLSVTIGLTEADSAAISRSGTTVPNSICGVALIDTGSTFSHIDEEVIAELGLEPFGRLDVAGSNGVRTELRYDAKLVFGNDVSLEILTSSLKLRRPTGGPILRYEALIGRDILASAILTYDGIHEKVVLQFGSQGPGAGGQALPSE